MPHVKYGRPRNAFCVVALLALLFVAGCDQDVLTQENNQAIAERKKERSIEETNTPGETVRTQRYEGEEADEFLLDYFSGKLEKGESLTEKELTLLHRLRERQAKRRTLRNGPPLFKDRNVLPPQGEAARPPGLDLEALSERVTYPYLSFISSRRPGNGKPRYRYDVRGLHLPESLLEDAVGTETTKYRYVVRDAEGTVQLYLETLVPKAHRVRRGWTRWIREWIAGRYGQPQATGKTSSFDCQYDEQFDGYVCDDIVVVCEGNYNDCYQEDEDGTGAPPDPVTVPVEENEGTGGSSTPDDNGLPYGMTSEEALDTIDFDVSATIVIVSIRDPETDITVLSTEVDLSGMVTLQIMNPEGISLEKWFEALLVENRKVVEGPIEAWRNVGIGVKGFSVSFPIPLDGYTHRTEETTKWERPGAWTSDSINEVETFLIETVCAIPEVEKTWKIEARGDIKMASIYGTNTNYTRSMVAEDATETIACRYVRED